MDKKIIGEKISSLRKEKGLTQKELADRLGVTDKAISKWETGVHFPDIAIMESLAEELEITVSELLGFEDATKEEVIKGMTLVSDEEKMKTKKQMKTRAIELIVYGAIGFPTSIYLSWILHLQGLQGGVYGITTNLLMILAMTAFVSGIETLINLRKL